MSEIFKLMGTVSVDMSTALANIDTMITKVQSLKKELNGIKLPNFSSTGTSSSTSRSKSTGTADTPAINTDELVRSIGELSAQMKSLQAAIEKSGNESGSTSRSSSSDSSDENKSESETDTATAVTNGILNAQVINKLAEIGKNVLKTGWEYQSNMDVYLKSIEALLGVDEKEAAVWMDKLHKFAIDTPLSLSGVMSQTANLLATGTKPEELLDVLSMIGDLSGGDMDKFKRISTAYWQIMTDGMLMAQDANQLTEVGIPIWQMVADYFNEIGRDMFDENVTGTKYNWDVATVRNLAKWNKTPSAATGYKPTAVVTSEEILAILKKAVDPGGRYYGRMNKYMETGPGQLEKVTDEWEMAAGELMKPVYEFMRDGGFQTLIDVLQLLKPILQVIADLLGVVLVTPEETGLEPATDEEILEAMGATEEEKAAALSGNTSAMDAKRRREFAMRKFVENALPPAMSAALTAVNVGEFAMNAYTGLPLFGATVPNPVDVITDGLNGKLDQPMIAEWLDRFFINSGWGLRFRDIPGNVDSNIGKMLSDQDGLGVVVRVAAANAVAEAYDAKLAEMMALLGTGVLPEEVEQVLRNQYGNPEEEAEVYGPPYIPDWWGNSSLLSPYGPGIPGIDTDTSLAGQLQTVIAALANVKNDVSAAVSEGLSSATVTGTITTGNIVLDTGTLVGELTPQINLRLGWESKLSGRG